MSTKKQSAGKQTVINVLLTVLFLALGIGLIVGGTFLKKSTDEKLAVWERVEGIVTDYAVSKDDDEVMYREIISYTVGGNTYTIKSSSSSNIRPSIGAKREVAYNPFNPDDAIIVSDSKTGTTLMFIVGGVFTAVGVLMAGMTVIKLTKSKKEQQSEAIEENFYSGAGNPNAGTPNTGSRPPYAGNDDNYMGRGYTPPAEPAQPAQPTDENPFEEFDSKNR
ncbi:MAG: DUF3592 domain-containing protein [Clostridia bacterium]|nr:DUF3592 domain-containing protein [Clostridia bacterium]